MAHHQEEAAIGTKTYENFIDHWYGPRMTP